MNRIARIGQSRCHLRQESVQSRCGTAVPCSRHVRLVVHMLLRHFVDGAVPLTTATHTCTPQPDRVAQSTAPTSGVPAMHTRGYLCWRVLVACWPRCFPVVGAMALCSCGRPLSVAHNVGVKGPHQASRDAPLGLGAGAAMCLILSLSRPWVRPSAPGGGWLTDGRRRRGNCHQNKTTRPARRQRKQPKRRPHTPSSKQLPGRRSRRWCSAVPWLWVGCTEGSCDCIVHMHCTRMHGGYACVWRWLPSSVLVTSRRASRTEACVRARCRGLDCRQLLWLNACCRSRRPAAANTSTAAAVVTEVCITEERTKTGNQGGGQPPTMSTSSFASTPTAVSPHWTTPNAAATCDTLHLPTKTRSLWLQGCDTSVAPGSRPPGGATASR